MTRTFELFHLSLHENRQMSLFDASNRVSREEWLRQAFSQPFEFDHRQKRFHWVPSNHGELISGNLVRMHKRRRHKPPEEGASEETAEEWQGAVIVIDPTHHSDGQKLSFERDVTVGTPRTVLQSMASYINSMPDAPYAIEPMPIFSEASFWNWAAAYEFRLRRIAFVFITPNMFKTKRRFDEDMRELGAAGVAKVRMNFDNGDRGTGIDANSETIRNGVDYAAAGGGSLTATAHNGDKFASSDMAAITKLPTEAVDRTEGLIALSQWFQKLLGRDK